MVEILIMQITGLYSREGINNMFNKLRNKLRCWLFKEELNKLNSIEKELGQSLERLTLATIQAGKANELSKESYETNVQLQKLITPLLDVGTDMGFRDDHSWAVVCVKGKPEYVKFVSLEHKDTREIIDFLKRYDKSNHVIDSPFAFRDMIRKELFI